jgi:hypothetical protein
LGRRYHSNDKNYKIGYLLVKSCLFAGNVSQDLEEYEMNAMLEIKSYEDIKLI